MKEHGLQETDADILANHGVTSLLDLEQMTEKDRANWKLPLRFRVVLQEGGAKKRGTRDTGGSSKVSNIKKQKVSEESGFGGVGGGSGSGGGSQTQVVDLVSSDDDAANPLYRVGDGGAGGGWGGRGGLEGLQGEMRTPHPSDDDAASLALAQRLQEEEDASLARAQQLQEEAAAGKGGH